MKTQQKYDALEVFIKFLDGFFIFFISINVIIFLLLYLEPVWIHIRFCFYPPCPPEYIGPPNIPNLRLGSIITIVLISIIFTVVREPLSHKLKSLEFKFLKEKFGVSEDYFKFYRRQRKVKDKDITIDRIHS